MKPVLHPILGLLLLALGTGTHASADAINVAVADRHIIPAYARLAEQTELLQRTAVQNCEKDPASLRRPFAEAFLAWQGIQHIRFGPVQVLSRDFRFQLWPDKRGSVGKHLARLLDGKDRAQLAADTFASGSAAVQGFGAAERLLDLLVRQPADAEVMHWRCEVMQAMSSNLAAMARETSQEWRDGDTAHRAMFATAGTGNAFYDSDAELSARLLNNLHTQLERIADQKLARPLGSGPQRSLPKRAEAWRSELSLPAIRENLVALQQLYVTGFATRLTDETLRERITQAFAATLLTIDRIPVSLTDALRNAQHYATLLQLRTQVVELKTLVGGELSRALGLPLGFNSLDGD